MNILSDKCLHAAITITLCLALPAACVKNRGNIPEANPSRKINFDPVMQLDFHPNIVWLVSEDLGLDLPAFGDSTLATPNLNRLANEGVRFTRVYSVSGMEVPNRVALVTGMYPTSIGADNTPVDDRKPAMQKLGLVPYQVVLPQEVKMMSEILRRKNYFCSFNGMPALPFTIPVTAWNEAGLNAHWKHRKPGQSFFAVFNFMATGEEYISRPYVKRDLRYDDPAFPDIDPKNYASGNQTDSAAWMLQIPENLNVPVPPYLPSTEPVKKDIRQMYSNILTLDRQAGIILGELGKEGLLDSTIVMWFSVSGRPLPREKRSLYERGIHVPMIVRFPFKLGAGKYYDELVSLVDFAPTVFSLSGIPVPRYIQGHAFLGPAKAGKARSYVFAASDRIGSNFDMMRAVQDERYEFIRNSFPGTPYYFQDSGIETMKTIQELIRLHDQDSLNAFQSRWFASGKPDFELFDTWNDPDELINLADSSADSDKRYELQKALNSWIIETGDMGLTPESQIIGEFWPEGLQPRTGNVSYRIENQQVILTSKTKGASIGYQVLPLDSLPTGSWELYSRAIPIRAETRVAALAQRIGYSASDTLMIEFR